MKQYSYFLSLILVNLIILVGCSHENKDLRAKYEPPDGKVIVFIGQDNESVGGNDRFDDGYVDNVGVPAGITHYIGLGQVSEDGLIQGLSVESTWGAGPMCLKYYLDSPILDNCIIHLSIAMVDNEDKVADGSKDSQIVEIAKFLKEHSSTPFFLRIGYEFDGQWNHYDSTNFKLAFIRIVDKLKSEGVENFATVFAATSFVVDYKIWEAYYPGDEYVDWCGYSYWEGNPTDCSSIQFARNHHKPVFIAEITPRGHYFNKEDGKILWEDWFVTFFQHIQDNIDVVKAIGYINCDWDAQPMWDGWGDTRVQVNNYIKQQWLEKMKDPTFVNGSDNVFSLIGFK